MEEQKILKEYFEEVHRLLADALSRFASGHNFRKSEALKLEAILQELIRIKATIAERQGTAV